MEREVSVPESEPGLAADRFERVHEVPGLVTSTPAPLRMGQPAERVENGVNVGRDAKTELLEIVPGIDKRGERSRRQNAIEATKQLCATHAARECDNADAAQRNRAPGAEPGRSCGG